MSDLIVLTLGSVLLMLVLLMGVLDLLTGMVDGVKGASFD